MSAPLQDFASVLRRASRHGPPALELETLRYVMWRFLIVLGSTAVFIALIALEPAYRFMWPFVWLLGYIWSLWETIVIMLDLFDHRAYMRQHLKGIRGLVRIIDVWWTREIILANLLFLYYLMPEGNYGRYINGFQEFDSTTVATMKDTTVQAYASILSFSSDITLTSGVTDYTARDWRLKLVLTFSGYLRCLNMATVVLLGLAKSNEIEMGPELRDARPYDERPYDEPAIHAPPPSTTSGRRAGVLAR